MTRWRKVEF